jgi:hypothetical protein
VRQNGASYGSTYDVIGQSGALVLDGVNDHAVLPALTLGGDMTVEAWVYADGAPGTWSRVVDLGNGQANGNLVLGFESNTGRLFFEAYNGGTSLGRVTATEALPTGSWQHVAATVSSANVVTLYVNGVAIRSGSLTAAPTQLSRSSNFVGRSNWTADAYLRGAIRGLRVYDDARSAAEVLADMAGGADGADPNLLAAFSLDGSTTGLLGQSLTLAGGAAFGTTGAVGADGVWREAVAMATDSARVDYTQTRSAFTATSVQTTISDPRYLTTAMTAPSAREGVADAALANLLLKRQEIIYTEES